MGVAVLVLVYAAICVFLFAAQRSMLYMPQSRAVSTDGDLLRLNAAGTNVLVTTRERPGPKALLYFGGNAEDTSVHLPAFERAFPQHSLYLMHYRGYGGSEGSPSERFLVSDALALYDQIRIHHPQVTLIGRSLGSGIAVQVATQRPTERLVLVTPYDSIVDLAAAQFPAFPVRWLLLDRYESGRYAPAVRTPTLIIRAERDEIIPRASTEALFRRFPPGVAVMKVIAGAGHNDLSAHPEYLSMLAEME